MDSSPDRLQLRSLPPTTLWSRVRERLVETFLLFAALSSILITLGIICLLLFESAGVFRHVSITEFLFSKTWSVRYHDGKYGPLPPICGPIVTPAVALFVALPIGSVVAIYLSEYAPFTLREILKPVLELLSAVPTVVYGYFALSFVTPGLKRLMPNL